MAKKDKGRERGIDWEPWHLKARDDIPLPKGKFRNLFEERGMIPESMKRKSDVRKSDAPESD